MNNTLSHAQSEFEILKRNLSEDLDKRPLILEFEKEILALVEKFGESGQSGGSAPFTASAISQAVKHLCMHEPIGPITGADDEWSLEYGEIEAGRARFQNLRLSSIFKDGKEGRPYYIYAIVFKGPEEYDTFTGSVEDVRSSMTIRSLPFRPKTFYIDVTKERNDTDPDRVSCGDGDYLYKIKDRKQLEEVYLMYEPKERR